MFFGTYSSPLIPFSGNKQATELNDGPGYEPGCIYKNVARGIKMQGNKTFLIKIKWSSKSFWNDRAPRLMRRGKLMLYWGISKRKRIRLGLVCAQRSRKID